MHEPDAKPLLRVQNLKTHFPQRRTLLGGARKWIKAVDDVSFHLKHRRTLGLVGESGCGKTTLGRTILRLIPPTSGRVYFGDADIFALSPAEMRRARCDMQIIFQDPAGSLNPRMRVETIVGEALGVHRMVVTREARRDRVAELLTQVGLTPEDMRRFPHEFSGGQRQRIVIARALSLKPKFIVCDEPVSALDVSIQSQILNLLSDLQRDLGLTYLFIAHDLAVVRHISDDVAVMYLGKIVEQAPCDELFNNPRHPYTQALLASVPTTDPALRGRITPLPGEVPSPIDPPSGCAFHPRCQFAEPRCRTEAPALLQHPDIPDDHPVACHFAAKIPPADVAPAPRGQRSAGPPRPT